MAPLLSLLGAFLVRYSTQQRPSWEVTTTLYPSSHLSSTNNKMDGVYDADDGLHSLLQESMKRVGLSHSAQKSVQSNLVKAGLIDPSDLILLAKDFKDRPEALSDVLRNDFDIPTPMTAHRIRAVAMDLLDLMYDQKGNTLSYERNQTQKKPSNSAVASSTTIAETTTSTVDWQKMGDRSVIGVEEAAGDSQPEQNNNKKSALFKAAHVNDQAKRRHQTAGNAYDYGLPKDYENLYPKLAAELDDFNTFMTRPSVRSQEDTIRPATANTYLRHAKLFLGWYMKVYRPNKLPNSDDENQSSLSCISIHDFVPTKEKESADCFLEFILWLRAERSISVSYEANVLRGLLKLLKFRFARESVSDPTYGDSKPFDDIPLIREIRKLHRDANKQQAVAPRSSDEERKWLGWTEYLGVIRSIKQELETLLEEYNSNEESCEKKKEKKKEVVITPLQRKIATTYQYYLLLSFFSNVPDRQRTMRELELGRSFVKNANGHWIIQHAPDDYKTGKTYGDRPPLVLSADLVPAIDDFLERWRPCLKPLTDSFFCQPRTGKPLTQDSVYQIVARNCYKYTGKRTNPHLLRDMIVTHIKEAGTASEQELEALALYMGHSVAMQRQSYDRRTLTKKVEPAVELLQSVNTQTRSDDRIN